MNTTDETASVTPLLTAKQVAQAFKVSRTTLNNWVRQGKLFPIRLGERTIRYRRIDVQALIETKLAAGK